MNYNYLECICNKLGTNHTAGHCDPISGQCPCLKGVTGLRCDQCLSGHWGLASGEGCQLCNCDSVGSKLNSCNEVTAMFCIIN